MPRILITLFVLFVATISVALPALSAVYGTEGTCGLLKRGVPAEEIAGTGTYYLDDTRIMQPRDRCVISHISGELFTGKCEHYSPQYFLITRSTNTASVKELVTGEPHTAFILHRCP